MSIMSYQTIKERVQSTKMRKETPRFGGPMNYADTGWSKIYGLEIEPFVPDGEVSHGMTYGLGPAGYDIRIGKIDRQQVLLDPETGVTSGSKEADQWLVKPGEFLLMSSLERFRIPEDVLATVHDKSSLARKGLALQNTVLEPGWEGWITLELSNHGHKSVRIHVGQPIAQVVFQLLDEPTQRPYKGRYQNAGDFPQRAIEASKDAPDEV